MEKIKIVLTKQHFKVKEQIILILRIKAIILRIFDKNITWEYLIHYE